VKSGLNLNQERARRFFYDSLDGERRMKPTPNFLIVEDNPLDAELTG
jgi:hypothetical protein